MDERNRTELGQWLDAARGRAAELARRCGVQAPEVSDWASGKKDVPVRHCPTVEEFTGIPCERLQPDVRWYVLRGTAVQGRVVQIGTRDNPRHVLLPDPDTPLDVVVRDTTAAANEPNQDRVA